MLLKSDIWDIIIRYDNQGFERQTGTDTLTIESKIFEAMEKVNLIPKNIKIKDLDYTCAGRTDKLVSSAGNVIALKLKIKSGELENLTARINSALPDDIVVFSVCEVPIHFTARYHCTSREYRYFFFLEDLNFDVIQKAAKKFEGEHNFRNFCKMKPEYEKDGGTIRTIKRCEIKIYKDNIQGKDCLPMAVLICEGSGFLYHQIRCMISLIKIIGNGHYGLDLIDKLLYVEKKTKFIFTLDDPENLLLYNCDFDKDLANFGKPNSRGQKFISKFFTLQYQKNINQYNLIQSVKDNCDRLFGKKFKIIKKENNKPFKRIKLN